jgi:hypothetical protein
MSKPTWAQKQSGPVEQNVHRGIWILVVMASAPGEVDALGCGGSSERGEKCVGGRCGARGGEQLSSAPAKVGVARDDDEAFDGARRRRFGGGGAAAAESANSVVGAGRARLVRAPLPDDKDGGEDWRASSARSASTSCLSFAFSCCHASASDFARCACCW